MPILQFKCPCGNEFEKILPSKHELKKWCKYCDALTTWEENCDPHSIHYKEKLCQNCMGNEHIVPVSPVPVLHAEESITELCPVCGQAATHVLRSEVRGPTNAGADGCASHSIGFRFNYNAPDVT